MYAWLFIGGQLIQPLVIPVQSCHTQKENKHAPQKRLREISPLSVCVSPRLYIILVLYRGNFPRAMMQHMRKFAAAIMEMPRNEWERSGEGGGRIPVCVIRQPFYLLRPSLSTIDEKR